jgi:hypothetical protein
MVNDERPLSPIAIGGQAKYDTTHASQYEDQCDIPWDISFGLAECFSKIFHGKEDSEEVECISGPRDESNKKAEPVLEIGLATLSLAGLRVEMRVVK